MLRDSLDGEFGGTAVEEANRLLKGGMELPRPMVGPMGNAGHLSKRDRALDQSTQGRAPHPRSLCCFLVSRSIQNGFDRMQIAKKDCPLLLVEVRIIKGGKLIEWLPVLLSSAAFGALHHQWQRSERFQHIRGFPGERAEGQGELGESREKDR